MIRNENQQDPNRSKIGHYGQNGPVYLQPLRKSSLKFTPTSSDSSADSSSVDKILQTFLLASRQSGYRIIDLNTGVSNGSALLQSTIHQGRRQSMSTAFLEPNLKNRPNLHVLANSIVTKILFENDRAIGVRFQRDWQQYSVFARQEVIISAGALHSPQLLMLSGIGPRNELNRHQIPVKMDLPGVGENLHDHVGSLGLYFIVDGLPEPGVTKQHLKQYFYYGKGPLAESPYAATIFRDHSKFNDNHQRSSPDSMLLAYVNGLTNREISPELSEQQINLKRSAWNQYYGEKLKSTAGKLQFTILPIVLKPKSRGTIRLKSANAFDPPLIDPRYLEHPDDLRQIINAMREALRLIRTKSFRHIGTKWYQSVVPGCEFEFQKFQSELSETMMIFGDENINQISDDSESDNSVVEELDVEQQFFTTQPTTTYSYHHHHHHHQQQQKPESTTAKISVVNNGNSSGGQNLPFYFVSSFMSKLFRKSSPTLLLRKQLKNYRSSSSSNSRRRIWRRSISNSSVSSYYFDQYWLLEPERLKNHPLMNKTLYGGVVSSSNLIDGFSSSSSGSNHNTDNTIGITVWNSHSNRGQQSRPKPPSQQQPNKFESTTTTKTLISPQLPIDVEPIVLTGYFDSPPRISTESPSSKPPPPPAQPTIRRQSYHTPVTTKSPPQSQSLPNRRIPSASNNNNQQQTISNKPNALDQYLRCMARMMTMPIGDYVGTCRMGTKNDHHHGGAVVDERFRVIGIRSLRVIDNSVIPEITTGSMASVAIMLGERGAEFIREDRKLKKN